MCTGPQASGFQGAGPVGSDGGRLAAAVAWRLRGWSRLLGSAWVAWPGVGVRVGVFMAWADGVVGSGGGHPVERYSSWDDRVTVRECARFCAVRCGGGCDGGLLVTLWDGYGLSEATLVERLCRVRWEYQPHFSLLPR